MRWIALVGMLIARPVLADDSQATPPPPTPFDQGKFGLGLGGGSPSAFGSSYFAIGGGAEYFALPGVGVGLAGLIEFPLSGPGPYIGRLTPGLRYVAQPLVGKFPLIPYVGAFYDHWFIGNGIADVDGVGGRAGLLYVSRNLVLGLGIVVEHELDHCTLGDGTMGACNIIYPDLTISLAL